MIAGGARCMRCGRTLRRNKDGALPKHTRVAGKMVSHVGYCPGTLDDWKIAIAISRWFGPGFVVGGRWTRPRLPRRDTYDPGGIITAEHDRAMRDDDWPER